MRVIVVGSGIAGLVAAIRAARSHEVLLVTKGALEEGSTRHAQGGIAAALFEGDSVGAHVRDTLAAGAGLCDPEAVRVLCEEGPQRVRDLIAFGVDFDRDPSGALARGLEAAHSAPRILHAGGDATGAAIEAALAAAVRATAVEIIEHAMLVDLVVAHPGSSATRAPLSETQALRAAGAAGTPPSPGAAGGGPAFPAYPASGRPSGASASAPPSETQARRGLAPRIRSSYQLPEDEAPAFPTVSAPEARSARVVGVELLIDGERRIERADAVILATGGAGRLYSRTTNPAVATGDGIAAAWRAGAEVADLEFVQFHPTALADGFLVSEAVRGEGAVLRDADGRRYMPAADPRAELAPRDVVARETARVMARQDDAPALLDATAVPLDLASRFPSIHAHLRGLGIDWARTPVPVTPAAHYTMGGVATDLHGRTSLPGLLAVGEVARTGVHGANRLASNSLLESLVFAWRAAEALSDRPTEHPARTPLRGSQEPRVPVPGGPRARRTRVDEAPASPTQGHGDDPGADRRHPTLETQDESGCVAAATVHPLATAHQAPAFPTGAPPSPTGAPAPDRPSGPTVPTRADIQALAWRDLGLVRDGAALAAALNTLADWQIEGTTVHDLENRNLLDLARLVAEAALARTGSVGAHHRSDDAAARAASA